MNFFTNSSKAGKFHFISSRQEVFLMPKLCKFPAQLVDLMLEIDPEKKS